jgi:hypothetical protein
MDQYRKRWMGIVLFGVFGAGGVLLSAPSARADDVVTFVIKRQEVKRQSRWSLADWLDTREKMRMQDLWLALHSPSPYEFFLGGSFHYLLQSAAGQHMGGEGVFAAYASIFGLQGHYEGFVESTGLHHRITGLFNLRVFGCHVQGTNLTLHGGLRNSIFPGGGDARQATVGLSFAIYFAKFFGIDGVVRYHFFSTPLPTGDSVHGMRVEGGPFIDFSFVRVFGQYFWEPDWFASGAASTRQGVSAGLRFFL